MATIKTKDGTEIYYKDWGAGQPIVFSHGWPLTGDDWDTQMLFFGEYGSIPPEAERLRVIWADTAPNAFRRRCSSVQCRRSC
jgi:pimeloyl-ACP methyl ester carboxylesterase